MADPAGGEHLDERFAHAEISKGRASSQFDVFQDRFRRVGSEIRAFGQYKVAKLPVGKIDRRDTNCAGISPESRASTGGEEAFHDVLTIECNGQRC
ncbi:hypothetical protein PR370_26365 [Mycobacterium marinum]|uniref:hypothetical protein n=1 Tax=Mycobacterium ulcerans group TaxID=2993898 RepID=UPI0015957132|nr:MULTISPECIES: hypothetical protein [Mycobacterium ulcerans group]MDC9013546.1 hypothetical protein [Mycobacterium marinum]